MTTELDQALLTGDADSIDESLNSLELDEALLFGDEDELSELQTNSQTVEAQQGAELPDVIDTTGEVPANAAATGDEPKAAAAQGSNDPQDGVKADLLGDGVREIDGQFYIPVDPKNAEIIGKNGKHSIPYAVLEAARGDAGKYRSEADELRKQLEQATTGSRKAELLAKQLEEAGITPERLPEELLNDPEAIQALQDEIGGQAGVILGAIVKQYAQAKGESQPETTNGASQVDDALAAPELKELNSWESEDPDRWQMALIIDNKLKNDPEFQSMSLQERFTEVQRRVKASFGDPVQASIEQELAKQQKQPAQPPAAEATTTIPNSPSSLGGTSTDTKQAAHEALAAQDPMALEKSLASMSPDEVEAFLANAAIALD